MFKKQVVMQETPVRTALTSKFSWFLAAVMYFVPFALALVAKGKEAPGAQLVVGGIPVSSSVGFIIPIFALIIVGWIREVGWARFPGALGWIFFFVPVFPMFCWIAMVFPAALLLGWL